MAIRTGFPAAALAASQSSATWSLFRPMTLAIPLGAASEAACIAAPRACTTLRPSSKLMAPANASAVYSPRLRPAATSHASMTAWPPSWARSFSTAASEAT